MPLDPTTVGTLKLWYKPEGLTGLNDGDAITTWTDSSASAVNMSQATAGNKPTYKTNIINGLAVARFDGSNDFMTTASQLQVVDANALFTVFSVAKRVSGTGVGLIVDCDDNASKRTFQHRYEDGSTHKSITFNTGGSAFSDTQACTAANPNVFTTLRETSQVTSFVNGSSDGATATTGTAGQVANVTVTLAAFNSGSSTFCNVDIAEVLIYAGALSAANRIKVEVYLAAKYKIAGANGPGLIVPSRQSRAVHTRR